MFFVPWLPGSIIDEVMEYCVLEMISFTNQLRDHKILICGNTKAALRSAKIVFPLYNGLIFLTSTFIVWANFELFVITCRLDSASYEQHNAWIQQRKKLFQKTFWIQKKKLTLSGDDDQVSLESCLYCSKSSLIEYSGSITLSGSPWGQAGSLIS